MKAKTKKRSGVAGTAVILSAAVYALLMNNPQDARLPDEAIVALYTLGKEVTADCFYGATFEEVTEEVEKRVEQTDEPIEKVELYAVPKEALQHVDFRDHWQRELSRRGLQVNSEIIEKYMAETGHPSAAMVMMWNEDKIRQSGTLLEPGQTYDNARFLPKEQPEETEGE